MKVHDYMFGVYFFEFHEYVHILIQIGNFNL